MSDQEALLTSGQLARLRMTNQQQDEHVINVSEASEPRGTFEKTIRPCVAEFVGTTLFVFIGTMSVSDLGGVLGAAFAHGLSIALLVAGLGNISGGHFNPAVTLAAFLSGASGWLNAVFYVISQLLGGILGTALTRGVLSETAFKDINGGTTNIGTDTTLGQGLLCEVLLTTHLVLVILIAAVDNSSKSSLAPLAIGFAVVTCILAGASKTGASMNPARSFGPAIVATDIDPGVWDEHWVYWVGPALGSLLAVVLYRLLLAGPDKRILGRS